MAAAFVLSLSAMVGAQRLLVERQRQPVWHQIHQMPGVERAWVRSEGGVRALWVKVAPTEDLPGLVVALQRLAGSGRMGRIDEVVLVDERTPALVAAHRTLSLVLQEGAASGAFTEMAARVEQQARALGVAESRVWVDSRRVYALLKDDAGYLVDVIERPVPGGPGAEEAAVGVRVAVDAPYAMPPAGWQDEGEARP